MNSSELNDILARWEAAGSDLEVLFSVPGLKFIGRKPALLVTKNSAGENCDVVFAGGTFTFSLSACEIKECSLDDAPEWLASESAFESSLLITTPGGFAVALVELRTSGS